MDNCIDCGNKTNTYYSGIGPLCKDCYKKRDHEKILKAYENVTKCSDFKDWKGRDLSELFWIHLGKYVKEPNAKSFEVMEMAYRWACHADHGLSNSFRNAMNWAGIDLLTDWKKWSSK